jgi:hypothetical protein
MKCTGVNEIGAALGKKSIKIFDDYLHNLLRHWDVRT